MIDDVKALAASAAVLLSGGETMSTHGTYRIEHIRDGMVIATEEFENLITTVGKNLILDQSLAGSAYTAAIFMGLISTASFTAVAVGDTMASHAGWLEAGNANVPHYTAPRGTVAWSAASGGVKATSAAVSFVFTGSGTVEGGFLVGGSGATNTIDNTGGTLISAGTLATVRSVLSGDTLNVSYSNTLT